MSSPSRIRPGGAWYQQWWVWVLVGLLVRIVIVAITSRGKAAPRS